MAKVAFKMPDSLQSAFEELQENSGEIIDSCVVAGAEVFEAYVKNSLQEVLSEDHKNGELIHALGVTTVKVDRKGIHNAKIGFREPRDDGGVNAKVATVLEYGRSGQPARPFLAPAKRSAKKAVLAAMETTFEQEVNKV